MTRLRVVYFGTPQFAVPTLGQLLESAHTVVGVVTQPDRPRGRGQKVSDAPVKAMAVARGLPVLQPPRLRDPAVAEQLRAWTPDLGVVAAYGKLIPDDLLLLPRLGMINVHASLLPRYRGAAPVHRAVMAGEAETGVTIMRVVTALDAGAMFASAVRPIGPYETSDVVERDLALLGAPLLVRVVDALAAGTAVETPQDDSRATYAPRLTKEEGLIDWARPARDLHNQVRGLHPWPHAYTFLDGLRVIVLRSSIAAAAGSGEPGSILHAAGDVFTVATGDGALALEQLQPEGRRAMRPREFLAGRAVAAGTRLGAR